MTSVEGLEGSGRVVAKPSQIDNNRTDVENLIENEKTYVKKALRKVFNEEEIHSDDRSFLGKALYNELHINFDKTLEVLQNVGKELFKTFKDIIIAHMTENIDDFDDNERNMLYDHISKNGFKSENEEDLPKIRKFFINESRRRFEENGILKSDENQELGVQSEGRFVEALSLARSLKPLDQQFIFNRILNKIRDDKGLTTYEQKFLKENCTEDLCDYLLELLTERSKVRETTDVYIHPAPQKINDNIEKKLLEAFDDNCLLFDHERKFLFDRLIHKEEHSITEAQFLIEIFTQYSISEKIYTKPPKDRAMVLSKIVAMIDKMNIGELKELDFEIRCFALVDLLRKGGNQRSSLENKVLEKLLPSMVRDEINIEEVNVKNLAEALWKVRNDGDGLSKTEKIILIKHLLSELTELEINKSAKEIEKFILGKDSQLARMPDLKSKIDFLLEELLTENGNYGEFYNYIELDRSSEVLERLIETTAKKCSQGSEVCKKISDKKIRSMVLDQTEKGKQKLTEFNEARENEINKLSSLDKKVCNAFAFQTLTRMAVVVEKKEKEKLDGEKFTLTGDEEKFLSFYFSPDTYVFVHAEEGEICQQRNRVCPRKYLIRDFSRLPEKVFGLYGLSGNALKNVPTIVKKVIYREKELKPKHDQKIKEEFSAPVVKVLELYAEGKSKVTELAEEMKKENVRAAAMRELPEDFVKNMMPEKPKSGKETKQLKKAGVVQKAAVATSDVASGVVGWFGAVGRLCGRGLKKLNIIGEESKEAKKAKETKQILEEDKVEKKELYSREFYNVIDGVKKSADHYDEMIVKAKAKRGSVAKSLGKKKTGELIDQLGDRLHGIINYMNTAAKKQRKLEKDISDLHKSLKNSELANIRGKILGKLHLRQDQLISVNEEIRILEDRYYGIHARFKEINPMPNELNLAEKGKNWFTRVKGKITFSASKDLFSIEEAMRYARIGCLSSADLINAAEQELENVKDLSTELGYMFDWFRTHPEEAANFAGDLALIRSILSDKSLNEQLTEVMTTQVRVNRCCSGISGVDPKGAAKDRARYLLLCRAISWSVTGAAVVEGAATGGIWGVIGHVAKTTFIQDFSQSLSTTTKESFILLLNVCSGESWQSIAKQQAEFKLCALAGEAMNLLTGKTGFKRLLEIPYREYLSISCAKGLVEKTVRSISQVVVPVAAVGAATVAVGGFVAGSIGLAGVSMGIAPAALFGIAGLAGTIFVGTAIGYFVLRWALNNVIYPDTLGAVELRLRKDAEEAIFGGEKGEKVVGEAVDGYMKSIRQRMPDVRDLDAWYVCDNYAKYEYDHLNKKKRKKQLSSAKTKGANFEKRCAKDFRKQVEEQVKPEASSFVILTEEGALQQYNNLIGGVEKELDRDLQKAAKKRTFLTETKLLEYSVQLEKIKQTLESAQETETILKEENEMREGLEQRIKAIENDILKELYLIKIQEKVEATIKEKIQKDFISACFSPNVRKAWKKALSKRVNQEHDFSDALAKNLEAREEDIAKNRKKIITNEIKTNSNLKMFRRGKKRVDQNMVEQTLIDSQGLDEVFAEKEDGYLDREKALAPG